MKRRVVAFRSWSFDDLRDFRIVYSSLTTEALTKRFDRMSQEIECKATALALRKNKGCSKFKGTTRMPRWDADKTAHLRKHYRTTPNLILALELGRSVKGVISKAHQMGMLKDSERLESMGRENVAMRRDRQ